MTIADVFFITPPTYGRMRHAKGFYVVILLLFLQEKFLLSCYSLGVW